MSQSVEVRIAYMHADKPAHLSMQDILRTCTLLGAIRPYNAQSFVALGGLYYVAEVSKPDVSPNAAAVALQRVPMGRGFRQQPTVTTSGSGAVVSWAWRPKVRGCRTDVHHQVLLSCGPRLCGFLISKDFAALCCVLIFVTNSARFQFSVVVLMVFTV